MISCRILNLQLHKVLADDNLSIETRLGRYSPHIVSYRWIVGRNKVGQNKLFDAYCLRYLSHVLNGRVACDNMFDKPVAFGMRTISLARDCLWITS